MSDYAALHAANPTYVNMKIAARCISALRGFFNP